MPNEPTPLSRRRALLQAGGLAVGGLLGTDTAFAAPAALRGHPPDAFSARAFGAKGDGKTDDTAAIQNVLGRTDWEYMTNCFCIGYKTGYRFMASASGPGNVLLT